MPFSIAYAYPVLALLIGWAAFDAGSLGGAELLPSREGILDRTWRVVAVAAGGGLAGWTVFNSARLGDLVVARLKIRFDMATRRTGFLTKSVGRVAEFVIFVVAFGVAVAAGLFVASASAVLSFGAVFDVDAVLDVGAFALGIVLAGCIAVAVAGAAAVSSAVAIAGFVIGAVAGAVAATTVFVFFLMLPWLNALADLVSLWATRSFLEFVVKRQPGIPGILALFALDLVAAVLCLAGLIAGMMLGLDFWQWLFPENLAFDWRAYRDTLLAGSWGQGTMLYLMVATTLVPTAVHLVAGIAGVLTHRSRLQGRVGSRLSEMRDDPAASWSKDELDKRLWDLRKAAFVGLFCATVLIVALGLALWSIGVRLWVLLPATG